MISAAYAPPLPVFLLHFFSVILIVFLVLRVIITKKKKKIQSYDDHHHHQGEPTAQIPPGSLGFLPFIGETLEFLSAANNGGLCDFVRARRLRYGNCFKTSIFGKTHVFASTVESAKTVLSGDFVNFNKRYIRSMAELVGDESLLLCASHQQHRLIRTHLSNLVSGSSMSLFIEHFDKSIVKTFEDWEHKGTVNVLEDALKVTFHAMCKMLVSLESPDELEVLQKDVAQVCQAMLAFPLKLSCTRFYKGLKARKRIMDALKKIIDQRRRAPGEEDRQHREDFLQSLLLVASENASRPCDDDARLLTDTQIQDNILTLIIAGQVTTASAMAWMVKYLDENQEVQDILRDEQMKFADKASPPSAGSSSSCSLTLEDLNKMSSSSCSLTLEDLNKMSYASKVVKETLRMASIVPWLPRVALKDCEIEGFKIKKGWIVNIDSRSIHMDSMVYHDPFKFNPSRFDDDQWSKHPYSFLAFGTGGRTCLGINLAKSMMMVFLHRLITTYSWKVIDSDSNLEKHALFSTLRSGCPIHIVKSSRVTI